MLLARGSHGNLHILSQQSEKLHEAFHGQGSRAVAHERRNVGLLDTQDFSSFGLLKAPSFNKPYDSRDAAIALHRTADSSLASPSRARLRTSLGVTRRLGNATGILGDGCHTTALCRRKRRSFSWPNASARPMIRSRLSSWATS